jgi:DNA processing protein
MDQRAFWVGFNHVKGVGAVRTQSLLDYFGDLEKAWHAPMDALCAAGLGPKAIESLLTMRRDLDLSQLMQRITTKGIQVIIRTDDAYPRWLREIDQPPPVLYIRGSLNLEDEWAVAIVGTRHMSAYGRQVAESLAEFLAANHVTVVSGMARGVDSVAHDHAMRSGGRTLAILGCGVDVVYPPEHGKLAERIIANGALVSDYAPGTPPDSVNFPPRNRIISGLSQVVVVVEAGEKSGALITAKFAADQGREVFAVPGNILAPQSIGTNRLIEQGARPLVRMQDVLDSLRIEQVHQVKAEHHFTPADEIEAAILKVLGSIPVHIDEICSQTGLPIHKVSATLAIMELKGMVRQAGGMNYLLGH